MQTFRIVITDDGEIGFFAEDGTYQQGKQNIAALIALIQAQGIEFESIGQVEQHRHSDEMAPLHDIAHQMKADTVSG